MSEFADDLTPKDLRQVLALFIKSKSVFNPNRKNKTDCSIIEQLCYKYSKEKKEIFFSDPINRIVFNAFRDYKMRELSNKSPRLDELERLEVIKSLSDAFCI